MFLQRRAVKQRGHILGDAGHVRFDANVASPSRTVGAIAGRKDVLVGEEGGCDLEEFSISYPILRLHMDRNLPEGIH